eukprot:IDg15296t1
MPHKMPSAKIAPVVVQVSDNNYDAAVAFYKASLCARAMTARKSGVITLESALGFRVTVRRAGARFPARRRVCLRVPAATFSDSVPAARVAHTLAAGGRVKLSRKGLAVTDRFGVRWMVDRSSWKLICRSQSNKFSKDASITRFSKRPCEQRTDKADEARDLRTDAAVYTPYFRTCSAPLCAASRTPDLPAHYARHIVAPPCFVSPIKPISTQSADTFTPAASLRRIQKKASNIAKSNLQVVRARSERGADDGTNPVRDVHLPASIEKCECERHERIHD